MQVRSLKYNLSPAVVNGKPIFLHIPKQQRPEHIIPSIVVWSEGSGNINALHAVFRIDKDTVPAGATVNVFHLQPVYSGLRNLNRRSGGAGAPLVRTVLPASTIERSFNSITLE